MSASRTVGSTMAEVAYIGGYTPDTGGSGTGITLVELGSLARLGETAASGPSFLAAHPRSRSYTPWGRASRARSVSSRGPPTAR